MSCPSTTRHSVPGAATSALGHHDTIAEPRGHTPSRYYWPIWTLVFCTALLVPSLTAGQTEPTVGQEGKDVPWVPTPDVLVDTMLKMAAVSPDDLVVDLGSGDGRTVIAAARLRRAGGRNRV